MLERIWDADRCLVLFVLLMVGCAGEPARIAVPNLDPTVAADRAIAEYDANGDRKLSKEELKSCPGLLSAIDRFDENDDESISSDELQSKLLEIQEQAAAIVTISCLVMHDEKPLEGATVKFVPESFLGEAIKPATGITASDGMTSPSIADEEIPQEYQGRLSGIHCGVYRVVITHPHVDIPARYNAQTELGRIVTRRDHDTLTIKF